MPASTQELLVSSAGLLVLASLSVYAGSYGSLKVPELSCFWWSIVVCLHGNAIQAPRKEKKKDANNASALDSDDEEESDVERITVADAYLFPVVCIMMHSRTHSHMLAHT